MDRATLEEGRGFLPMRTTLDRGRRGLAPIRTKVDRGGKGLAVSGHPFSMGSVKEKRVFKGHFIIIFLC